MAEILHLSFLWKIRISIGRLCMLRRQCINLKLIVKLIVVNLVFPVVRSRGRGSADVPFQENVPGVGWHAAEPQKSRTGSTNTYGINRYMLTYHGEQ